MHLNSCHEYSLGENRQFDCSKMFFNCVFGRRKTFFESTYWCPSSVLKGSITTRSNTRMKYINIFMCWYWLGIFEWNRSNMNEMDNGYFAFGTGEVHQSFVRRIKLIASHLNWFYIFFWFPRKKQHWNSKINKYDVDCIKHQRRLFLQYLNSLTSTLCGNGGGYHIDGRYIFTQFTRLRVIDGVTSDYVCYLIIVLAKHSGKIKHKHFSSIYRHFCAHKSIWMNSSLQANRI